MNYTTWTEENLAAEKRALEQKHEELQRQADYLTRSAISAFDERDRVLFGKGGHDSRGRQYQEQRDEVWGEMAECSYAMNAIIEELRRRAK